jgi:hypothetical protein
MKAKNFHPLIKMLMLLWLLTLAFYYYCDNPMGVCKVYPEVFEGLSCYDMTEDECQEKYEERGYSFYADVTCDEMAPKGACIQEKSGEDIECTFTRSWSCDIDLTGPDHKNLKFFEGKTCKEVNPEGAVN